MIEKDKGKTKKVNNGPKEIRIKQKKLIEKITRL